MKKTQIKGALILLLTAFIWGSSFVAQSVGMENVQAFTFGGIRTLMGAAALLPFILVKDITAAKKLSPEELAEKKKTDRRSYKHGVFLGLALCVASNFQQWSFNYTASGKIAFITAFYMLFVPILGLFLKKKVSPFIWGCAALGCVGLYFLCIAGKGIGELNKGDLLAFICSIFFAVHILVIERFEGGCDAIKLSFMQFVVSGGITCILMFIFDTPDIKAINGAILPLLYSGVLSCGAAYTLQIIGQKYTEATVASLVMCMESVFGVLCGAIILKERMTPFEIIGCVVMFTAIILSQVVPAKKKSNSEQYQKNV